MLGGMAERPTGTVTFLLTGVEGSTQFWALLTLVWVG